MENSILNNWINNDTLQQQDQKNLVAKNCKKAQSEITAKLSEPKMLGAFLNSVWTPPSNVKVKEWSLL
jgi:hypothetical protein